jgi:hypothetical protein
MFFILHCLVIIFIWPSIFHNYFIRQMVEKLRKQIQHVVWCDDNIFMHNKIWCKTFTSKYLNRKLQNIYKQKKENIAKCKQIYKIVKNIFQRV